jgi:geranylgeranylglycerol-phosphate geranylgeranyltransferase
MNAFLEIIRPKNAVMGVIAVFIVQVVVAVFTYQIFIAALVVFLIMGAGNALNDYFDCKIDAVNKPERPIPSGRMSKNTAAIYSAVLFVVGVVLAAYMGPLAGIIAASSSILLILYAYKLKKMSLVGNASIALLTGLCFIFAGVVVGNINVSVAMAFYAFLMTMAREMVKDIEDVEGDKMEGATTFPIVHGKKLAGHVAAYIMIFASLTSPILYFMGFLTVLYVPVLLIAIIIFLNSAYSILKDQSLENTKMISKKLKIGMAVTFLAFTLGSPFLTSWIIVQVI